MEKKLTEAMCPTVVPPDYLGDAVYATDCGWEIVLTTGSHHRMDARDIIVLEPAVINALICYINRVKEVRNA
jgi:catalase (peroxidase I)